MIMRGRIHKFLFFLNKLYYLDLSKVNLIFFNFSYFQFFYFKNLIIILIENWRKKDWGGSGMQEICCLINKDKSI